nr:PREDICTED: leucine-rich repeat extensin-like protein 6 isoform X2 [Nicotiana tabacum]
MSRYTCCGGYMPCSGRCGESHCPELCLCTEVFLCFANSVASTRFMLQDEFNLQTTKCDNCIIGFMFCLQQVACILSCIACITGNDELQEASRVLNCCSDMVYCTVCSCMQTQHMVEMNKRDGKFGPRPMVAPAVQQMSRLDQPLPPTIGYAPPQPQAYPPKQLPTMYPPPPQQSPMYPPPPQQSPMYPPPPQQPYGYPPPPSQPHGYPPANYAPGVGYPPSGYPR